LEGLVALSKIKIDVRTDKARLREGEAPKRVGDARKLQALGWAPTVPLEQTLRDALDAWRAVVRR
jgi:nucleoside-diphosphate-sugar epimerase